MAKKYTNDFVKNHYKDLNINVVGDYHCLNKKITLECNKCHFRWEEFFTEDNNKSCTKCDGQAVKVTRKNKVGKTFKNSYIKS